MAIESLDQAEDHLIFAAVTDDGTALDEEAAARLLTLPGSVLGPPAGLSPDPTLEAIAAAKQEVIQRGISERNARFFEAEAEKLDGWADDLKLGLEREIKELDRQIKEARRAPRPRLRWRKSSQGRRRSRPWKPSATSGAARSSTPRTKSIVSART